MIQITEEPGKVEILQSRIDQQVELICILKQRADEYLQKYMAGEERIKSMEKILDTSKQASEEEHKQCILLRQSVDKLETINRDLMQSKQICEKERDALLVTCNELNGRMEQLSREYQQLKVINT